MALMSKPSAAFATALTYITVGTLVSIWTVVAQEYYPPATPWGKFLLIGFLGTGIALLVIGLLIGYIGRAARHAELPPAEVAPAAEQAAVQAAAHPPVVVAGAPAVGGTTAVHPEQGGPRPTPMVPPTPATPPFSGS